MDVLLIGLLGLLVGSFLNVVIYRLPKGESLLRPASHCPACGAPVKPYDNIPVLSWLLLRGRCRNCGARHLRPVSAGRAADGRGVRRRGAHPRRE